MTTLSKKQLKFHKARTERRDRQIFLNYPITSEHAYHFVYQQDGYWHFYTGGDDLVTLLKNQHDPLFDRNRWRVVDTASGRIVEEG